MKKISISFGFMAALYLSACNRYPVGAIALDTGHSLIHPGAVSAYGKPEFAFNAALAKAVNHALAARGVSVVNIGNDGSINRLQYRTQIANSHQTGFMLSLHHDSVQPQFLTPWRDKRLTKHYSNHAAGFSLFISRKNPSWLTALSCASAIGKALVRSGFFPSPHHGEKIAGEYRTWADINYGVYFYDDLVVLKTAHMPAVLLEAGVIVNPVEEHRLLQPEVRIKIAEAVAKGLADCGIID